MEATKQIQQLQRLISDYLTDETRVHEFAPFLLDSIIQNDLLIDSHNATSEELVALKRKWTVRLNALLQSKIASTRWAALSLVKVTCEQSLALYMAHALSWSGQCLGFLARPEPTMVHTVAIEVLALIFTKAVGKPEIQAEVTSKLMPRYNQLLLSLSADNDGHKTSRTLMPIALSALTTNMRLFPSNTRHVMDKIMKTCVIPSLEGRVQMDPAVVGEYLSTSSKAGGKTSTPTAWEGTVLQLIGTIHIALDRLFDTIDEEDTVPTRPDGYESLSSFAADHVEAFPEALKRVQYIMDVISTFLTIKTEVAVVVPLGQIIQLVCRIFNVYEGCAMREFKPQNEYTSLMTLLPSLFINTNKLLASVIHCSHKGMTQLGKLLSRILLRLLTESNGKRSLRISVYNLMTLCLQHYGHAFASVVCKPLAQAINEDVSSQHKKNTVDIIAPSTIKGGKKRRLESKAPSLLDGSYEATIHQTSDILLSALDAAEQLLIQYGSSGMPASLRLSLDSMVVTRLLNQDDETDIVIKAKLYECLLSSVLNPPTSSLSSLLPHAIRIFSAGLNENAQELRSICSRSLNICDLCIHTRLPPIQRSSAPIARMTDDISVNLTEEETVRINDNDEKDQEMQQHTEPSSQPGNNTAEASNYSTFAVKVSVASPEPVVPSSAAAHDSLDRSASECTSNAPSTSVVEVYQSSSTVMEKEVLTTVTTMSDVEFVEDERSIINEDIEMLLLKMPPMLDDTNVVMSADETTSKTAATTIAIDEIAKEDDDAEEFLMPDIDMAGPDDDD
ncbi:rRNA processing/ribosome biogenesis-domain-containing protein [Dichotomocladium elegans]|nr:rRNA processing/ribosome biogenesis-domain-containing protein [Dichotomocladium elegans]